MIQQGSEIEAVPVPEQLYVAVRDVIYSYKEWKGKIEACVWIVGCEKIQVYNYIFLYNRY